MHQRYPVVAKKLILMSAKAEVLRPCVSRNAGADRASRVTATRLQKKLEENSLGGMFCRVEILGGVTSMFAAGLVFK